MMMMMTLMVGVSSWDDRYEHDDATARRDGSPPFLVSPTTNQNSNHEGHYTRQMSSGTDEATKQQTI